MLAGSSHALLPLTSPATKKSNGASSSLALYLAMIFSAMGWISCFAASDSPSSSESAGHSRGETKQREDTKRRLGSNGCEQAGAQAAPSHSSTTEETGARMCNANFKAKRLGSN